MEQLTEINIKSENQMKKFGHLISNLLKPKSLSSFTYLDMRFDNQIIAKERSI